MHWSAQGFSHLGWFISRSQLRHCGLQLLVKFLGRPSKLTVAIHAGNLVWPTLWCWFLWTKFEAAVKICWYFNSTLRSSKLEQNLEFVIVGEISWEVSNPGPNVEDALKLLTFSNAVNQPCKAWLSVLVSWMQIYLASLHISCCFLGFTCFLKTCRRPESSKHTTGWLFWQTWVTASCSTEKLRFKRPAIGEFQGSFCLLGFHGVLNISGRSTRHKTLCDVFWPTFPVWQEFFELLQVFDWLPWQAAGCDGLFQS